MSDIETAKPGEWIMYHFGFLWVDRLKDHGLHKRALRMRELYDSKRISHLIQRKIGPKQYEYYAIV